MAKRYRHTGKPAARDTERWLAAVPQQVDSRQFSVAQMVMHKSRITQIDRTERLRLDPPPERSFSKPSSNQPDDWRE
jgi:hypothetical protein